MTRTWLRWLLLPLLAASTAGCKERADQSVATVKLVGGSATTPGAFPGVIALGALQDTVNIGGDCTGTALDATHILTAAHCVAISSQYVDDNPFLDGFSQGATLPITNDLDLATAHWDAVVLAKVDVFPAYLAATRDLAYWQECTPKQTCQDIYVRPPYPADVALLTTKDPMAFDADFAWAGLYSGALDPGGGGAAAPLIYDVGYGCEAGFNGPIEPTKFRQKAAAMLLAGPGATAGIPTLAGHMDELVATYTLTQGEEINPAGASLCPGDSGGPLFYEDPASGTRLVAGVNSSSWTPPAPNSPGISAVNLHTRLDVPAVRAWLASELGHAF